VKNPRRRFRDDRANCGAYALSFFISPEHAIAKYAQLAAGHPNVGKTLGSHLARGSLVEADGIATPPSQSGHFDLFEEAGRDLFPRFEVIQLLSQ
jgi:hypothetical protein